MRTAIGLVIGWSAGLIAWKIFNAPIYVVALAGFFSTLFVLNVD